MNDDSNRVRNGLKILQKCSRDEDAVIFDLGVERLSKDMLQICKEANALGMAYTSLLICVGLCVDKRIY